MREAGKQEGRIRKREREREERRLCGSQLRDDRGGEESQVRDGKGE